VRVRAQAEVPPRWRHVAIAVGVIAFVGWLVQDWRDTNARADYARQAAERAATAALLRVNARELDRLNAVFVREHARDTFAITPEEPLVRGAFTIDDRGGVKVDATDPVLRDAVARELAATIDVHAGAPLAWHGVTLEAAPTLIAWTSGDGVARGFVIDNPVWTNELAQLASTDAVITVHLGGSRAVVPMAAPGIELEAAPHPRAVERGNAEAREIQRSFTTEASLGVLLVVAIGFAALRGSRTASVQTIPEASINTPHRRSRGPAKPEQSIIEADAVVERVLEQVDKLDKPKSSVSAQRKPPKRRKKR
jgi:hypothetical protein